ncbi:hypothetical protein ES703_117524 [subsurface metagenome]
MEKKTIIVLATLDTKGKEAQFVKEEIENRGHRVVVIDTGVVGKPYFEADISREEVSQQGDRPLSELLKNPDRKTAAPVMAKGAKAIVTKMVREKKADGIISMGGTQGTTLATEVMRALPVGFPKVMVSTVASGNTVPFVDIKDIAMLFPVADILGLNPITKKILSNAAGAICGMAESKVRIEITKPLVGITTVGITTQAAIKAKSVLEGAGYETIVFHAVGTGGRAMEDLMKQGFIKAVLDIATIEVTNEMYDALLAAGPERLTTAGRLGLPQVIAPGAIAILVYGTPDTIPAKYKGRKMIAHSPKITDVRINKDEQVAVAHEIVRRLKDSKGSTVFMVPRKGYDSYSVEGMDFWELESDQAFVEVLKKELPPKIPVIERDRDINDPEFAEEMANTLIELMRKMY